MNKYIETFLTSIAAIVLYKTLIKVYEHFKYKPDEVDTAPNDFPSLEDQIDLNRTFRRQIEKTLLLHLKTYSTQVIRRITNVANINNSFSATIPNINHGTTRTKERN